MLQLPATPAQVLAQVIVPTFQHLLPGKFDSAPARVQLLAIAMQESELRTRRQDGGPARSLWQFEQGGGIHGVLTHPASSIWAKAVCLHRAVAPTEGDVYAAFLVDDLLACAFARLLLWTDAAALPALGDADGAWAYYQRNWRPGAYARGNDQQRAELVAKFKANYAAALAAVTGASA